MYPSIKYKFVRRAIKYFVGDLNAETQGRIETCLEMIEFGMGNTLLTKRYPSIKYKIVRRAIKYFVDASSHVSK
jgi:uncharacterized protein (DUF433 family)